MQTNTTKNTVILFSHGFGIRKDNLGLFTFLSEKFQGLGYQTVLFDYYDYNEQTKEIFTIPFSKQAEILQKQIDTIREQDPEKTIMIIAQSQGCLIPAICDVTGVTKIFGISPFLITDKETVFARYSARKGSTTDFNSISKRKHSDGKITVIPPEYWTERFSINQYALYSNLALKTSLTLVYGTNDELAKSADITKVTNAKIVKTDSDHDFTGENRDELYKILIQEMLSI